MKTIKFRAWHKGNIYNVDTLGFDEQGLVADMCFAHYERNLHLIGKNDCESFDHDTVFTQFTGLTDKTFVEIYVGDILSDGNRKFKVFSVNGGFAINTHQDDFIKENIVFYESTADMQTSGFITGSTKVIGNIYENPEML